MLHLRITRRDDVAQDAPLEKERLLRTGLRPSVSMKSKGVETVDPKPPCASAPQSEARHSANALIGYACAVPIARAIGDEGRRKLFPLYRSFLDGDFPVRCTVALPEG